MKNLENFLGILKKRVFFKIEKNWIRRRWWEGRTGNSVYLMFVLTLLNFILITHRFLIEENVLFEDLISDLWFFGIIFIITYIPISILIGYWHRKTQWKVELTLKLLQNPMVAKMFRVMLDVQTGKASKEEIEELGNILKEIEKK